MTSSSLAGRVLRPVPLACLAGLALQAPPLAAQQLGATATVIVTGNPLAREQTLQPTTVLTGDALALRRAGTLGDTLAGLPGVAASGFGPQSARPVIRGLDGDRIRLLDNGGASADASNLSFDHAVAVDPLVVERIEVLRGPAALLYGGNAVGGVVNTLDNRIPRDALDRVGGRVEWRLGGAAAERAAAAVLEGGAGGLSWHADLAGRRSSDLRVPRFTPQRQGEPLPDTTRVANSAGDSGAGAFGLSWAGAAGHLGAAVDTYRNHYGVTVDPEVTIRVRRDQLQLAGERRGGAGPWQQLEFRLGEVRYRHEELEGSGAVGTTFRSTGRSLRLQARQAPLAGWHGVVGLQLEQLDFAALGEEAFVPATRSRSSGLFLLQERALGAGSLSAGLRVERARVRSEGDGPAAAPAETEPRFGPAVARRFTPRSASLALQWPLAAGWSGSASVGHTERAPAYYELFADGLHVATGAYERGDPALATERSGQLELGLQWKQGMQRLRASLHSTRFSNYIALQATGQQRLQEGEDGAPVTAPEYRFLALPARLSGLELEAQARLLERPWTLDGSLAFDLLRGQHRGTGEPLPRLSPWRLTLGLQAARGPWQGGLALQRVGTQRRVAAGDVPTPGHALVNLWAGWRSRWPGADALWTLKLDNAGNRLATQATALRSARELAPLGARALSAGLRLMF
ncbi:MAG: TonB-dependent receptor [Burkholderiales bacterium]|nr:TonB-dependent receptor [Burkholderiales bacterium]